MWSICYLTANTHYDQGALILMCDDLSQFTEDTGVPSIPVRELISWHDGLSDRA